MQRGDRTRKSLATLTLAIAATVFVYASSEHTKLETRHNHGYVLQHTRQVRLSVGTGKLVFLYKLPVGELNISLVDSRFNAHDIVNVTTLLQREWSILTQLHKTRMESVQYVQREMRILSELLVDVPTIRKGTSKRSWWSSAWSFCTGLAEADDVEKIQKVVKKIERGIAHAASVWKSGSQTFLAAIQIERKRVDALQTVLEATRRSLWTMHDQFANAYLDTRVKMRLLGHMMHTMRRMTLEVAEIDHVYHAVSSMTAGRLSHFILPHEQLETSLEWFQSHLDKHHSGLIILHRDLTYYFRDGSFHVFKHANHLIINVDVPLTVTELQHDFTVFSVTALPLSAPDDDPRHYTKIRLDFEAVIYSSDAEYYTVVHRLRDLSSHEVINLQSSALTLRSRDSPSCALMLIEGTLRQIQTTCKYDVILAPLPTSMFKIDEHWILLSNIPKMTLTCPVHNISEVIKLEKQQVMYFLNCGCRIRAGDYVAIESSVQCSDDVNTSSPASSIKHVVNLPYLIEFVDHEWLRQIAADDFLNFSLQVDFPKLLIEDPKYGELLAADAQRSVDLSRAINRTKSSIPVFGDLADYLYSVIVSEQQTPGEMGLFDVWSWLVVGTATVAGISLFLGVTQHMKIKALYAMIGTLNKASAAVITFNPPTTAPRVAWPTTPGVLSDRFDLKHYIAMLSDILPAEITLLMILLIIILLATGYMLYVKCHPKPTGPCLFIEVGNEGKSCRYKIAELKYNITMYKLTVDQDHVRMQLTMRYHCAKLHWNAAVRLENKLLSMPLPLQSEVTMPLWMGYKVQGILAGPHYIAIQFLSHNGKMVDAAVLKPWPPQMTEEDPCETGPQSVGLPMAPAAHRAEAAVTPRVR